MTEYVVNLDEDQWLGVPPSFPHLHWSDAETWASELAAAAVPDDAERRARFEAIALGIASNRPASADHVLWFAPVDGRAMGTAFLTVFVHDAHTPGIAELALHGIDSATPGQVHSHASATFGEIVQSATTVRLSDVGGDDDGAVAGCIRTVAAAEGLVFMLNAVDEDLEALAIMQRPLLDLMDAIELLTTDDAVDRAADAML